LYPFRELAAYGLKFITLRFPENDLEIVMIGVDVDGQYGFLPLPEFQAIDAVVFARNLVKRVFSAHEAYGFLAYFMQFRFFAHIRPRFLFKI
jgi:hypothetical protein